MERPRIEYADSENTPGWVKEFIYAQFPITHEQNLGLISPWPEKSFCFAHPPHEEAQLWCEKAVNETSRGVDSVLLLPAVFNSIYWRTLIYPNAAEIRIVACPIKKPGAKKQIVSQMALVIFAGKPEGQQYPPIFVVEPDNWEERYYKRPRNLARFRLRK